MHDALKRLDEATDVVDGALAPLKRGGVRKLHGDVKAALVLVGDISPRKLGRRPPRERQEPTVQDQDDRAAAQSQAHHAGVQTGPAPEYPVERSEEPAQD